MDNLHIRPAQPTDIPALLDVITRAYRSTGGWTTEADLVEGGRTSPELLQKDLDNPQVAPFVAEQDGQILGCAKVSRIANSVCDFGLFAVDPNTQSRGLGKLLLAHGEQVALTQFAAHTLEIQVLEHRPELVAFYERRGFAPTGEWELFDFDDAAFGRAKRPGLRFQTFRKALSPQP